MSSSTSSTRPSSSSSFSLWRLTSWLLVGLASFAGLVLLGLLGFAGTRSFGRWRRRNQQESAPLDTAIADASTSTAEDFSPDLTPPAASSTPQESVDKEERLGAYATSATGSLALEEAVNQ